MNLITWLRRFSIRSRLITCMVLVVGLGSIVGSGISWQLWSLKGEFDAFTGATITPRAVVKAVKNLLRLQQEHPELLRDAPSCDATP